MGQHALRPKTSLPFPALMLRSGYAPEPSIGYATIQSPSEKLAISACADDVFSTGINCSYAPTQFSGS